MKQLLQFADKKTYFGVTFHRHGVKVSDLKELPFFDLFTDYHGDKLYLTDGQEDYIPLIDWEGFCFDYVMCKFHFILPPFSLPPFHFFNPQTSI